MSGQEGTRQSDKQVYHHYHLDSDLPSQPTTASSGAHTEATPTSGRTTRRQPRQDEPVKAATSAATVSPSAGPIRRSARRSVHNHPSTSTSSDIDSSAHAEGSRVGTKRKAAVQSGGPTIEVANRTSPVKSSPLRQEITTDRKGKKRAARSPTPPRDASHTHESTEPTSKRPRTSTGTREERYSLRSKAEGESQDTLLASSSKGKGRAQAKGKTSPQIMSRRNNPRRGRGGVSTPTERAKKGDTSTKNLIDDPMDEDNWMDEPEASRSRFMGDDSNDDEHMEDSGHDDDDDDNSDEDMEHDGPGGGGHMSELARQARESGLLDEATANAIFGGGGFRAFGGMMSGLTNRFKRLRSDLRSKSSTTRLSALRECSELLLVSNEDTLGGTFSTQGFATEFIAILKGRPNIDENSGDGGSKAVAADEMDEDAQLAAALAMSTGGAFPAGFGADEDEMECQLVACRCLAHLMEALPGSGNTLVHLGVVQVLCSKLNEIEYIELAEQTLSTMEKISAEVPAAVVREGGLGALLNFLPFFSTNVQRTAVTAAANCCRNISPSHFAQIREVFPILRDTLSQADQRLVEQATLAVVRTIEAYRFNAEHLEGLLDVPTVVAVNSLLMPSGGSPLLSPNTYTQLLKALTTSARSSAKVAIAFLEAGMTNTIYQILTGVLPSSHEGDEEGAAEGGQGLAGGVADMAVLQNLAHRPKDQVEESLALICELLPPASKEGVFDSRAYTERSLSKIKKGRKSDRSERPTRRSNRVAETSGPPSGSGTPDGNAADLPAESPVADPSAAAQQALLKAKRETEIQMERRIELFKDHPELLAKFIKSIVPVLVDVYAASISTRVRSKVLTGLTKAVAFAEVDALRVTLKTVPMASFLCAIISSKDHSSFVLSALQVVELLATKLPDVYQVSFQREGVVFEIEALAAQELTTAKVNDKDAVQVKREPEESDAPIAGPSTATPTSGRQIPEDLKPILEAAGLPSHLSSFLLDNPAFATPPSNARKPTTVDPNDANIVRARVLLAKKIFENPDTESNSAKVVLEEIASLVKRLCLHEASEAEIRDTLRDITKQFTSVGQALSSFELLKSGLVDGLLEFVDIDGVVSSAARRAMLFEIFADTSLSNPSPLTSLVKRLHESLGRLEDFQVEIAFGGHPDTSGRGSGSTLSRSMRIRLQADEGQDLPKSVSNISVTINAIAPLRALGDYLRPRLADPNYASGGALASMFSAYTAGLAAARARADTAGGSGGAGGPSAASSLLTALNTSIEGGLGGLGGLSSSAPATTNRPRPPAEASAATPTPVTRRRSARLSGLGLGEAGTGNVPSEAGPAAAPPVPAAPIPAPAPDNAGDSGSGLPPSSLFPGLPMNMDMDFDDEDNYSDEDYDAEVFEDEMEEELSRPQEKVVNMSVAPDGSRVEAKTPEGTRIATPNQAAAAQGGVSSGSSTDGPPRTGSYAGAVKAAPTDFHIEFSINGTVVEPNETIYGAAHKFSPSGASSGLYGSAITFKYKKVDGPRPTVQAAYDAPSPASVASTMPAALDPTSPTFKILRLLRVIHTLSTDAVDSNIDENIFVNNKLTAKLTRQLEETMILASGCLPGWAEELPKHFSFLFPFEARYAFLQSTSFGYHRLLAKASTSQTSRTGRNRDDISHLARMTRQKVRISRAQLLESAAKVLELYGTSDAILEVEYFDEIGTGLGPTLEFYSIASKEFARRALKIWRDDDESKEGAYVFHPKGLFPAPIKADDASASARLAWYKTLGTFIGRALLDGRIIDVNLNKVYLKLILGGTVKKTIANLKLVDAELARSLERLQSYLQTRKEIEALQLPPGARRNKLMQLTVSGAKLADLSLDFTLPGYNIELKPGGAHIDVDDHNLEEYLEKVLDLTLGSGIAPQVKAFREGFSMLFSVEDMDIFSPSELGLLFGNAEEDWSRETLEHAIKADHGYNLDSRTVQNLVEVMSEYTKEERRQFLQFITGAPKLPIGGFRGLNPQFTVVRKPHEHPFRADDYLPSVMTCAQYLKLPDYSSKQVLTAQLSRAMLDGGGSFHLS